MQTANIVNLPGRDSAGIDHGSVMGGGEGGYVVQGMAGTFVAAVAFSCIVKPMAGDKVLYTRADDGSAYILSILARPTGPDAVVSFPGDVVLEASKGRVSLAGAAGIDMSTAESVNMLASEVNVAAERSKLTIADIRAASERFTGNVSKVRLFSDAIDVVAKRATQRMKTCFRWVEQIEHVTAGQMINSVRNLFSVRARQSAIKAKDDVKIDGKRVHLG